MKNKILFISIPLCLVLIIIGIFFFMPGQHDYKKDLQFTKIEKGNLKISVSCTGTINPKGTVEIGTQVSGTISKVYVDYNDPVKKNQVLAVLDTTLLEIAVMQAEAELVKASTQYRHDLKNYEDNKSFHEQNLISDYDFDAIKVVKESSYAAKLTADTNLKKAKANLSYAIIRSPIDGTVIARNVEQGQTVAASLSTPTLFKIAQDLSNMQIDALVDENDIGKIKMNQRVIFTVESYPEETFAGVVTQVRLEPETVSNVVNYHVIINAKNDNHMLLPGMTATIDIIIEDKNDILLVSNSVLKFRPTKEMLEHMKKNAAGDNARQERTLLNPAADGTIPADLARKEQEDKNMSQIWFLDRDDNLRFILVKTGLTDGQKTEILDNPEIEAGREVIAGSSGIQQSDMNSNRNGSGGRMGPPPIF